MRFRHLLTFAALVVLMLALAACGGGNNSSTGNQSTTQETTSQESAPQNASSGTTKGDPAKGEQLYAQSCAACHGPDARGIQGLGKNLRSSEFVKGLSDDELVEFIKKGRDTSDPANTTGVAMPPKGGNPSLTDQDLYDIVAYIRSIEE
nr:cytochrome c [Ardenticatena sp.]